jgi:hypothetical protein
MGDQRFTRRDGESPSGNVKLNCSSINTVLSRFLRQKIAIVSFWTSQCRAITIDIITPHGAPSVAHRRDGRLIPIPPDMATARIAGLADKAGFQIGEPDLIGPSLCADRDRMAAMKVRAIDQKTAHAVAIQSG